MSKTMITIGSVIDYPTVHDEHVTGQVELILKNTVIIRDTDDDTHLVLKSILKEDGLSVDDQTYSIKTRYNRG
ncbi:hypothetical protein DOK76_02945 [Vagococcus sp. DIV0080]|uniref:Uncharacterized protein n=1 Tax=Candidatus Vagococcus giribetii TaxID=2230876 RepID=A0ABS3HQJ7_9ENTE|nr:hypothetical protein [Vagococcus sp. DIV0080]MBO0476011.1 hypothetical protein [Vagococcus sp. DIV0080]